MSGNLDKMSGGDWYITDDSVLDLQRERQALMERYNATSIADPVSRRELLQGETGLGIEVVSELGLELGQGVMGLGHGWLNTQLHGCIPQP